MPRLPAACSVVGRCLVPARRRGDGGSVAGRGASQIARKMQLADAERVRGAGTAQVSQMLLAKGDTMENYMYE